MIETKQPQGKSVICLLCDSAVTASLNLQFKAWSANEQQSNTSANLAYGPRTKPNDHSPSHFHPLDQRLDPDLQS